jgi:hypothetical protein
MNWVDRLLISKGKQYGRLEQYLLGTFESQNPTLMRRFAIGLFALQIALCLSAALTHVMLHGDGAFFVYALSVGEPWALKWQHLSTRVSTYVLTVLPTEWIAQSLHLSPMSIAALNGFIFYLVPAIQFVIACSLVWKSHPRFLIFPIAQYALSSAIGFGYPSEILLSPGFLWMALFLILKQQEFSGLFVLSFLGLLFSHEVAVPSAVLVAYLALMQARERDNRSHNWWRFGILTLFVASAFVALIVVRLNGGGSDSNSNAIYVVDPRRIFNNPTWWFQIAAFVSILCVYQLKTWRTNWIASALVAGTVFLPWLLASYFTNLNFSQGRYDSVRSIVGLSMFILTLCFMVARRVKNLDPATLRPGAKIVPYVLAATTAIAVGSDAVFLRDWTVALQGLDRVITSAQTRPDATPQFVSYTTAKEIMLSVEVRMNDRIGFPWVLPFRSIVLADGRIPSRIVYADVDLHGICDVQREVTFVQSAIPLPVVEAMRTFTCTYVASPEPPTISKAVKQYLMQLWGAFRKRLFGQEEVSK